MYWHYNTFDSQSQIYYSWLLVFNIVIIFLRFGVVMQSFQFSQRLTVSSRKPDTFESVRPLYPDFLIISRRVSGILVMSILVIFLIL